MDTYLAAYGLDVELSTSESYVMQLLESAEKSNSKPYDLLIVDYDTPIEGGLEFVKKILENPHTNQKTKIMRLIPLMREDIFEKIDEFGIDMGATKPIIPSVLYNSLLEIFKVDELNSNINMSLNQNRENTKLEKQYHVLVVEDNKTNQIIAKSILEEVGIEVRLSENGEEGVNYFRLHANEIDLILMDLHMPILNGYEATKRIRKINSEIPIVAMTADAITGVEDKCKRAGITSYISKPYEPDKFIDTVIQLLELHKFEKQTEIIKEEKEERTIRIDKLPIINEEVLMIDETDGLKRLGNNRELYDMVLETYLKENELTSESLNEMVVSKNYKVAAQIVHKVKSSSGNIGAKDFYIIASEFQKALEQENILEIEQLHLEFNNMFTQVLKEINRTIKKQNIIL